MTGSAVILAYARIHFGALAAALCLCGSALAQPASSCKVHDAELQERYAGGCVNGLAEGQGEARGTAIYKGAFKAGRKHGKGEKTWPATGDRYEGDFVDDRKEGTGTYAWGRNSPNAGEWYTGGFVNDRRHGHGLYVWPNGDRYDGPWANDGITGTPTKGMVARARMRAEHAAAVGRPGVKVCREMRVGVATEDLIRATVLAREGDNIRVRIDNPGLFDQSLAGRRISKGDVISDALRFWMPCG